MKIANDAWVKDARKKLLKERSVYERKVLRAIPTFLKRYVEKQRVVRYAGHTYFADIFIRRYNIAIEVDGSQHYTPVGIAADATREYHFAKCGILTLRISNRAVADKAKLKEFMSKLVALIASIECR